MSNIDLSIQSDIHFALRCFATTADEQKYWNGFSIYCMQVAAGFINEYKTILGKDAPGLSLKSLMSLSNLRSQSKSQIEAYSKGTTIHEDFKEFVEFTQGKNSSTELSKQLKEANKKNQELMDEIKYEKEKSVKHLESIALRTQGVLNRMDEISEKQDSALEHREFIVKTLEGINVSTTETSKKIIEKLSAYDFPDDGSMTDEQEEMKEFLDSLKSLYESLMTDSSKSTQSLLDDMKKDTEQLKNKITQLQNENTRLMEEKTQLQMRLEGSSGHITISRESTKLIQVLRSSIVPLLNGRETDLNEADLEKDSYENNLRFLSQDLDSVEELKTSIPDIFRFIRLALYFFQIANLIGKKNENGQSITEEEIKNWVSILKNGVMNRNVKMLLGYHSDINLKTLKDNLKFRNEFYQNRLSNHGLNQLKEMFYVLSGDQLNDLCIQLKQGENDVPSALDFEMHFINGFSKLCFHLLQHLMYVIVFMFNNSKEMNEKLFLTHFPSILTAFDIIFPGSNAISNDIILNNPQYKKMLNSEHTETSNLVLTLFNQGWWIKKNPNECNDKIYSVFTETFNSGLEISMLMDKISTIVDEDKSPDEKVSSIFDAFS